MAENEKEIIVIEDDDDDDETENLSIKKDSMECPICLQTCIHPAKLPCGHIFCFLCVKGVAYKNRRCAMCRREIPPEFLDHPQLVLGIQELCKTKTTEDGYQWFYEGRNGWWQYDERTSQDIEEAYKKGEKSCTILVAGYVYVVDFEAMLQQRQNDPSRRRRVKRDLASIPKKGVAGLRIDGTLSLNNSESTTSLTTTTSNTTDFQRSMTATDLQQQQQQNDSTTSTITADNSSSSNTAANIHNYRHHHSNSNNLISTIAATDAASRIASDIIGSTLAHADDIHLINSDINLDLNNQTRELLEEAEELLNATVGANLIPIIDHHHHHHNSSSSSSSTTDLFSQTLENFRTLTLRNVIDSSDSEDDNEQIIL